MSVPPRIADLPTRGYSVSQGKRRRSSPAHREVLLSDVRFDNTVSVRRYSFFCLFKFITYLVTSLKIKSDESGAKNNFLPLFLYISQWFCCFCRCHRFESLFTCRGEFCTVCCLFFATRPYPQPNLAFLTSVKLSQSVRVIICYLQQFRFAKN